MNYKLKLLAAGAAVAMFSHTTFAQETIELDWMMWGGSAEDIEIWGTVASMVTDEYPHIQVEVKFSPWHDFWTKLPILAASGEISDIVSIQNLRMPNFEHLLEPLDPYIEKEGFSLEEFTPSVIDALTVDGTIRALPYDVGPWVMFYNREIFERKGVEEPKDNWSWEEFAEMASRLTGDGVYGSGVIERLPLAARATGVKYVNEEGNLDIAHKGMVDFFQGVVDLVKDKKAIPIAPAGVNMAHFNGGLFENGQTAMYVDGPWTIFKKRGILKFDYGIAPLPGGKNGLHAPIGTSGFGISRQSEHKDEVWKAISVITGDRAQAYLGAKGRALPSRTALRGLWYDKAAAGVYRAKESINYSLDRAVNFDVTKNWNEVENLINQYSVLSFSGAKEPSDTLKTIQALAADR
ncbi:sugar ABC transporter substrate-binding protein [Vibrio sp. SCSIO 43132]|uniref:ABC transporter substrate-binding protein n=1 Tax=Vibrio sp. SCSIO 43132 TaxID=2779363 RepID=UPI001CA8271D|nr:sugar ABC transporter substrate-binding protein [Vibrio sp. SCSIO 43132]UAB69200.1 sugar ABC transporter substrate-binding protein [Vibrio sp. SCSIO 43132]